MSRWNSLGVRTALVITVCLVGVLVFSIAMIDRYLQSSAMARAESHITGTTALIMDMIDSLNGELYRTTHQLHRLLELSHQDIRLDPVRRVAGFPVLLNGDGVLNGHFADLDAFTGATGAVATVFVRDGDEFIRIATSLTDRQGQRAMGTRLGAQHPAYRKLLEGGDYTGRAELFGRSYYTRYTPLLEGGQVVGALFIGNLITDALEAIEQTLLNASVGDTGYPFVFERNSMTMVIHPTISGQSVAEAASADGQKIFQVMAQQRRGVLYYDWREPDGQVQHDILAFDYYEPWDMVIASRIAVSELMADTIRLRTFMMAGALMMVLLMAVAVPSLLHGMVSRPLRQVVQAAARIADGDFRQELRWRRQDELGQLAGAFDHMTRSLSGALGNVNGAVEILAAGAQELSATALQLTESAQEQDQSTGELAAAVSEMQATVEQIARNIEMTAARSQSAYDASAEGQQAVAEAIQTVAAITRKVEGSSQSVEDLGRAVGQVNEIARVINDITEQTNLLALNAAIEAARAGDHGRGFAVVADEVRKLAERTQDSTREISERIRQLQTQAEDAVLVIRDSVGLVDSGNRTASVAGQRLEEITSQTGEMADMIGQVAAAAQEQAATNNEIARSVEQVKHIAEQNSNAASGIAEAAGSLSRISEELQGLVGLFRLREEAAGQGMANSLLPRLAGEG